MNTTLLAPAQWAQMEFGLAELGDQRRTNRLVNIAQGLAKSPGGTLPQAFPAWDELKGAYRFFNQAENRYERILAPHWQRTRAACREAGEYLLIEDTTELDYTNHPATMEMGSIGDGRGRGLWLHSTLAVRVEGWNLDQRPEGVVLGLFGQQCWSRRGPARRGRETWRQRVKRPRESQRWAAVLEEVSPPPQGSRWIYIADREADFYEPVQRCQRCGIDFIIRGYRDRVLADGAGDLKSTVGQAPVLGQMRVEVRSRGGEPARTAIVAVRSVTGVWLQGPWRPGGERPDFPVNVVEVREVDAPPWVKEPLYWLLLTSLPCTRWAQVRRIIGRYTARWWVEEFHKALKTGTRVEDSQMERAYKVESLVAVLGVVAVRLLNAKWLARTRPNELVDPQVFGPAALAILAGMFGQPKGGWTHGSALVAVARVGGFLARRHDGSPGWQTIWRGWQRLMWMCDGVEALNLTKKRCG
jgi:hypothetical protein